MLLRGGSAPPSLTGTPPPLPAGEPNWMGWVTTGIEWLGCDPAPARAACNSAPTSSHENLEDEVCALHGDFLDALLEEGPQAALKSGVGPAAINGSAVSPPPRQHSFTTGSQSSLTETTTLESGTIDSSLSSTRTRYRRHNSEKSNNMDHAFLDYQRRYANLAETSNNNITAEDSSNSIIAHNSGSKNDVGEATNEYSHLVESLVDEDCTLQKDKGKGEPLGTLLKARGREECLFKLREKMKIVHQVSRDQKSTWNKKPPIVTKVHISSVAPEATSYIETRSMMELRLGFLSMQYGLLLHWNVASKKIVFMVLRKMCPDSFYKKKRKRSSKASSQMMGSTSHAGSQSMHHGQHPGSPVSPSHMLQPKIVLPLDGQRGSALRDAIWDNDQDHLEVLLLEPVKESWTLQVQLASIHWRGDDRILSVENSNGKNQWTLSLTCLGQTQVTTLEPNEGSRGSCKWQGGGHGENTQHIVEECELQVRLLLRREQENLPTIVASRTISLEEWMSQPHPTRKRDIQLRLSPFGKMVQSITLQLTLDSPQAVAWFDKLQASMPETDLLIPDVDSVSSTTTSSSTATRSEWYDVSMDWLCGICWKEHEFC